MRGENVSGLLRSSRRPQVKTNPERFVLSFIKFLGTPLCIAAFLAATVAVTRARDGQWEQAVLAASIALACGGAGFGAIWWVRFHARAADPSERLREANPDNAMDVARRLGCGRSPHFVAARRESPDVHRHCLVRRDVPDLFRSAASRTPKRRLLLAAVSDLPAGRRRHADVGDANAAAIRRIRRVAVRDGVGARANRRRAHRIDSYRQAHPAGRAGRARTRMHQPHDARPLAQSHSLGPDFVARRSNFDQRLDRIDPSRVHDRAGLQPH